MSQPVLGRPPEFVPKLVIALREGYAKADLLRDLSAGLAVAIVALPLSLAIAIASGAPPQAGLVTLVVGGFLISLLGGSRTQIGGPTAAFIVVVYTVIHEHGMNGLATATFLAGLILVVAALLRVGSLVRHVPEPVIRGFTVGIAIVIAASQIRDFVGLGGGEVPAEFIAKLEALWGLRASFNVASALVGLGTLATIIGLRIWRPRFPGLVVAVLLAALAVPLLGLPVDTIASRFGDLDFSLGWPALPDLSMPSLIEMAPSAFIIAFLAGVESLLSAAVADKLTGSNHRSNTEMLGQGAANAASALMGGLPATGAIARTATNIRAGGRTPVAGLAHVVFVLAFLLLAAPLVGYLALPSLAAVLLVAAWGMSEPHKLSADLKGSRGDAFVLIVTLCLTVLSDLALAIIIGTALAFALRFWRAKTAHAIHAPGGD